MLCHMYISFKERVHFLPTIVTLSYNTIVRVGVNELFTLLVCFINNPVCEKLND